MKRICHALLCLAVGSSTLAAIDARAQDAAEVNAKTIRIRLENDRVRVLEAVIPAGEKERMHSHPANVIYVIEGGKLRSHAPDGTTTEATLDTGEVLYREPVTHWAENIGTTELRAIIVELKGGNAG